MSEKEKQELQKEILALENEVKRLENSTKEIIQAVKERISNLKDIAWDRQSKKESSSMFKVLNDEKTHTNIKSNIGDILVDTDFMQKQIKKHLDNPALRGMVTSQEMLSFPKVAKNVEPEKEARGYTWQVKADDENVLTYGSRKYKFNNEEVHRLATNHSKTEANERMAEEDRRGHPYHPVFNDLNFRKSANEDIIPQNQNQSQESLGKNNPSDSKQEKMNALREQVNNIVKNRTTNSSKDLSLKIDREK